MTDLGPNCTLIKMWHANSVWEMPVITSNTVNCKQEFIKAKRHWRHAGDDDNTSHKRQMLMGLFLLFFFLPAHRRLPLSWHVAKWCLHSRQCIHRSHLRAHSNTTHTCRQLAPNSTAAWEPQAKKKKKRSHRAAVGSCWCAPLPGNNRLHLGDWVVK